MEIVNRFPCVIERVIDGDTFIARRIDLGFRVSVGDIRIRVKDYAAAERGKPGGSEATSNAKKLFAGSAIAVEAGFPLITVAPFHDRMTFERYVCDVWIGDRLFRELMVSDGFGAHTPFYQEKGRWAYGSTRTGTLTVVQA